MKRTLAAALAALALFACQPAIAAGLELKDLPSRGVLIYVQMPDGTYKVLQADSSGQAILSGSISASLTTLVTTTDKGGTITTGGTAQPAIAANASRKIWCIQNDPAASENLFVRVNGTASATSGIVLQAGQQACGNGTVDTAAVSVFAATTSHRYFGFEGQ